MPRRLVHANRRWGPRSCLDDDELQYLGAPWEEYSRTADELSLDVLRYVMRRSVSPGAGG